MTIDVNCDMGEGMPHDAAIMPYISSANIACGYHAGDVQTMRNIIDLCLNYGVAIGAHPGFNDKPNFGRLPQQLSSGAVYRLIWNQLEMINQICKERNAALHHVKPHGALYNMAASEAALSGIIAKAVYDFNPGLVLYGLSGSVMISEAKAIGLPTANEVFADRTYQTDGTLTPRSQPDALMQETTRAVAQVVQMITEKRVTTVSGVVIPIEAETICIHGDGDHAVAFAKAIHMQLTDAGYTVHCVTKS